MRKYFVAYAYTIPGDHGFGSTVVDTSSIFRCSDFDGLDYLSNEAASLVADANGINEEMVGIIVLNWRLMEEPC